MRAEAAATAAGAARPRVVPDRGDAATPAWTTLTRARTSPTTIQEMELAVVWRERQGPMFAGKAVIGDACFVLTGTSPDGRESRRRLALSELAGIQIGVLSWAAGANDRGLLLVGRDGGRIELRSLEGAGALHELAEAVAAGIVDDAPPGGVPPAARRPRRESAPRIGVEAAR